MRPEKIFRPRRGRWPQPRGRCSVSARLSSLLPTVLILMAVLSCVSCATTKKTQTEEKREIQTDMVKTARDTAVSATKVIRKETVPSSKAEISISVDSLLKLPADAVYTNHSGQATATVGKKGDEIYVAASCDSLQREVEYFEELYYRARDALEQKEKESNSVETACKQSPNSFFDTLYILAVGVAFGMGISFIIFIIKRKKQ